MGKRKRSDHKKTNEDEDSDSSDEEEKSEKKEQKSGKSGKKAEKEEETSSEESDSEEESENEETQEKEEEEEEEDEFNPVEVNLGEDEEEEGKEEEEEEEVVDKVEEVKSFADLHLSRPLLKACSKLGYEKPTPIQSRAIPIGLSGKDICGSAHTGSGFFFLKIKLKKLIG